MGTAGKIRIDIARQPTSGYGWSVEKFVINISRGSAEELIDISQNQAMISITGRHDEKANINQSITSSTRFARFVFDDTSHVVVIDGRVYGPIEKDEAAAMVNFIEKHKDCDIIVHCKAGVARSAAVCLFIHQVHGHKLRSDFWKVSAPNQRVLGQMLIELHRSGLRSK